MIHSRPYNAIHTKNAFNNPINPSKDVAPYLNLPKSPEQRIKSTILSVIHGRPYKDRLGSLMTVYSSVRS